MHVNFQNSSTHTITGILLFVYRKPILDFYTKSQIHNEDNFVCIKMSISSSMVLSVMDLQWN